jgi:hypothetical protein
MKGWGVIDAVFADDFMVRRDLVFAVDSMRHS